MTTHIECAAGACIGALGAVVLRDIYFAAAFLSAVTGAFLGCVGVWQWFKSKRRK